MKAGSRIIKNRKELTFHGNRGLRRTALSILEYGLRIAHPYEPTRRMLKIQDGKLKIKDLFLDLRKVENIYVLGVGKASLPIAKALEDVLADRVTDGLLIVKKGQKEKLERVQVVEAGHPVPDEEGSNATQRILDIAKNAKENDLVFCPLTGGCSSLLVYPAEGISLKDKRMVSSALLNCGAPIKDVNTVRRHISLIKGGRLAKFIHTATCVTLSLKTTYDDMPWPDPTLPDPTTFQDAVSIIERYGLMEKIPESVRKHLLLGIRRPEMETIKKFDGMKVHVIYVVDRVKVCESMVEYARRLGLRSEIFSTKIEGESKEVGLMFSAIAGEIEDYGRPFTLPCAIIASGETAVSISRGCGVGGPSQELALASSLRLDGRRRIVIASVDSDGNDGITDAAGGIVDYSTIKRLRRIGLDVDKELDNHNSNFALKKVGDIISTGFTGTNILDINLILVGR
ncbi:MAG: glycerate kinase type-2 family protein [Nitrososphaeria archaeon]